MNKLQRKRTPIVIGPKDLQYSGFNIEKEEEENSLLKRDLRVRSEKYRFDRHRMYF